ncbi:TrmH family RNA methyltransferase [Caminibacter pacificus]|uniref:tRNA (guanosine(18)-2'-O)-methyltransferase n=1 Tax=Caminibacter pacificus TaxID=1424653 RepID=A0AAJ4UX10_9BACT|nr:TrmH family RNA methyltransferase [Caminibacter pacificus]QCI29167.1 tRNA (guanine-N2)-dimethyltransferase [Caminibacter pacificus]ROR38810.1 tRNA (guanosine-2'-O-)-methyltransferase [Caminibacter pacificus]
MYLVSEERLNKMKRILETRQDTLRVFMDYVYSPHNLSAIVRTCDAVNVGKLYYRHQKKVKLNNEITMGAHKWIFHEYVDDIEKFYKDIKSQGYQVVVTLLDEDTVDFREVDYTKPTLIVLGNEVDGASEISIKYADKKVIIPMYGMSQSLNVSVANAVILYEAQRQRAAKGMYDKPQLPQEIIEKTLKKWAYDDIIEENLKRPRKK